MAHQRGEASRIVSHPDGSRGERAAPGSRSCGSSTPRPFSESSRSARRRWPSTTASPFSERSSASARTSRRAPTGITATLRYQGCNDLTCVEPASASADDTIRVGTLEEAVEQLDAEIFSKPPFAGDDGAAGRRRGRPAGRRRFREHDRGARARAYLSLSSFSAASPSTSHPASTPSSRSRSAISAARRAGAPRACSSSRFSTSSGCR